MAEEKTIKVFIARLGEEPKELNLPEGSQVADALRAAGITVREVAVNGLEATMNTKLQDGDFIATVAKQVDGGR
jgi:sulfur carrier protein ThiS